LLFGKRIEGKTFWDGIFGGMGQAPKWLQQRNAEGSVEHKGFPILPGVNSKDTGIGKVKNDMLCETWPKLADDLETCLVIFRVTERIARIQWGEYVLVTETGPHPFSIVN